jgi:predicted TIM-barrel fold metal-dependent hydrolase
VLEPLSKRVNDLGWHVQIHMLGDHIVENADLLLRLPSPDVFDHMARIPEPAGVDHPAFALVLKLLDKGRAWVSFPAPARTRGRGRRLTPMSAVARGYVKASPERMVWCSDWPHQTEKADAKPDDAVLFDLLTAWARRKRFARPYWSTTRRRCMGSAKDLIDGPDHVGNYQFS